MFLSTRTCVVTVSFGITCHLSFLFVSLTICFLFLSKMNESSFATKSQFVGVKRPNPIFGSRKCPPVTVFIGEFMDILGMDDPSPIGYVLPDSCLPLSSASLFFASSASEDLKVSSFQ